MFLSLSLSSFFLPSPCSYLDKYIRAICKVTLPLIVASRKERIRILTLHLASITKAVAVHSLAAADAFFQGMECGDGADEMRGASRVLESLSLPGLPEVRGGNGGENGVGGGGGGGEGGGDGEASGAGAEKPPVPPAEVYLTEV